jgi:hypothetical protein
MLRWGDIFRHDAANPLDRFTDFLPNDFVGAYCLLLIFHRGAG